MSKLSSENANWVNSESRAKGDQQSDFERLRLITKAELRRIVPYTPQHILRLEKRGLFPRRLQIGANRVGWLLSEVEEWLAVRIAERNRFGP